MVKAVNIIGAGKERRTLVDKAVKIMEYMGNQTRNGVENLERQ